MSDMSDPIGIRVERPYRFWQRWLKRWLRRNGYVLCYADRYKEANQAWHDKRYEFRRGTEVMQRESELQDRIKELEAEIEAHKRVEAALAERAIGERLER